MIATPARVRLIEQLTQDVEILKPQEAVDIPDPVEWIEETQPFAPDPWQAKLLRDPGDNIALCCARQIGKTLATAWKVAHHLTYTRNAVVVLTARTERQSKLIMRQVKKALRNAGVNLVRSSIFEVEMANGSECYALPGSEDTVRGVAGVSCLIVDEAAFTSDGLWDAVSPMIGVSGGQSILLSSADAKLGFFHKIMTGTDPAWSRYRVTAYECPRYSHEWLEWKRKNTSERVFKREFLAEFVDVAGVWIPDYMRQRAAVEMDDPFAPTRDIGVEMENHELNLVGSAM